MSKGKIADSVIQLALAPRNLARAISQRIPSAAAQTVTIVSLDGQWMKLLQVEGGPHARRISRFAVYPVQSANLDEIRQQLKKFTETEGLAIREVLIANPTHLSTIRLFSLPSSDSKEIRDIVSLQAEKHTPYAKEEIVTDFKIIHRESSGYSRVMLVISHQDVIQRAVRLAESCGWPIERVGCELEGLVVWSRLALAGAGIKSSGATLVVDVDASTTLLLILHNQHPRFQRNLPLGLQQIREEPAAAQERLMAELQRSLEAFELEGSSPRVEQVIVTGSVEELEEVKTVIQEGLDLPAHLIAPWKVSESSDWVRSALERPILVSFASLIGLAAHAGEIDLTPQIVKFRLAFEERAKTLVLLGCQFIGALILVSLLLMGRAQKQHRYYTSLRVLNEQSAPLALELEKASDQLVFVKDHLRKQGRLLEVIQTLAELSPPEVQWKSLNFNADEVVVLSGMAQALPKVYEFSGGITDSALFGEAEARKVAKRRNAEEGLTDFELRCPLEEVKVPPGI